MLIMTILGSPRRQGNTAKVLTWIEEQLRAHGDDVDRADIIDYNVQGCGECMACKKGTIELCSITDDANGLYRRMVAADLVLFAAPVFCWGFPAQLKGLLDRMFCLMDFDEGRLGAPRLHGKPMALVLTAGGEKEDNVDLVVRGFEQLVEYVKGRLVSNLLVTGCTEPAAIGQDVEARVVEFARVLAKGAC